MNLEHGPESEKRMRKRTPDPPVLGLPAESEDRQRQRRDTGIRNDNTSSSLTVGPGQIANTYQSFGDEQGFSCYSYRNNSRLNLRGTDFEPILLVPGESRFTQVINLLPVPVTLYDVPESSSPELTPYEEKRKARDKKKHQAIVKGKEYVLSNEDRKKTNEMYKDLDDLVRFIKGDQKGQEKTGKKKRKRSKGKSKSKCSTKDIKKQDHILESVSSNSVSTPQPVTELIEKMDNNLQLQTPAKENQTLDTNSKKVVNSVSKIDDDEYKPEQQPMGTDTDEQYEVLQEQDSSEDLDAEFVTVTNRKKNKFCKPAQLFFQWASKLDSEN